MTTSEQLKEKWHALGYPDDMGSATVVPPPDKDFVRAYYLTSAEHGINAIALSRLKVARFSDVNDPFEVFGVNFHERGTRKIIRSFKNNYDGEKGLLCFTSDWSNSMIWSHYASKHKGICLGFNLKRTRVLQVEYVKDRIRANLNGKNSIPKALEERLLRTKADYWEYENELRILVDLSKANREQGLYFLPFDADMQLAEVILGPLSELPVTSIRKLTRSTNPDAAVFKSRLARRSFRVVPDGRSLVALQNP